MDAKVLIDVLQREGFGVSVASECPTGKEAEPRQCRCGWTGKRGDTIGMGWCPKCRRPSEPVIVCPKCSQPANLSRPAEPEVGIFEALFACREHGEFFLNAKDECRFVDVGGAP